MIISTDHTYIRISTWQSELSRDEVSHRFPDKRSWWIDSSGEVFDAGKDHEEFIKEHPELFDSNEVWTTYHAVRKFWVRVSAWGPSFTINSRDINQKQLDAAQILYMREGEGKKVEFFQDGVIPTSFDKEEFLEINSVNQLKRMRNRIGSSLSSRSWFISPSGEVIDCGQSHDACMRDRPEIFGNVRDLVKLIPMGWIRLGNLEYFTFIDCDRMTAKQLDRIQELVIKIPNDTVEINKKDRTTTMTRSEFLSLNSPGEINRRRAGSPLDQERSRIFLSDDYKKMRFAASPSDYMKETQPDKRSWWVDPNGKIYDVGHDHNKFLQERPKTFKGYGDINEALTLNWVRVAFWGGEFVVHCHMISRAQIEACQEIYKSLGGEYRVYVSTLNKYGYISPHDFIWAYSSSDIIRNLFNDPAGIRSGRHQSREGSENRSWVEDRAWLISTDGEVISCGRDHEEFVLNNKDFFKERGYDIDSSYQLVNDGWARIGLLGPLLYLDCEKVTELYFKKLQEFTKKLEQVKRVKISRRVIDRRDFLSMDDPVELKWVPVVSGRKVSSLPKSRNFLMGISLDTLSWPLRRAFDLLGLSDNKDRLSANQVVNAFQANDEFLQDHIGRTSTELIRDLNYYFQYGPAKGQLD